MTPEQIDNILDGMDNIKFHCDMRYCDREDCKKQVKELIEKETYPNYPNYYKPHEVIENELELLHWKSRNDIVKMRGVDEEDYGAEYNAFGMCIGDSLILSIHDMIRILQYEITKEIVREWRDMQTMSHYTPRIKQAIKENKNVKCYNIITFWRVFGGEKPKKQMKEELEEGKKQLKEIKKIRKDEVEKIKSQYKN